MTASWSLKVPDKFDVSTEDGLVQKEGWHGSTRRGSRVPPAMTRPHPCTLRTPQKEEEGCLGQSSEQ